MILDKELYEARGPFKSFLFFLKKIFTFKSKSNLPTTSRGPSSFPVFKVDEDNNLLCRTCRVCEDICPTSALKVVGVEGQVPDEYDLDLLRCTQCSECIESCPTGALISYGFSLGAMHAEDSFQLNKAQLLSLSHRR